MAVIWTVGTLALLVIGQWVVAAIGFVLVVIAVAGYARDRP
jgi:hypothetical protein